MPPRRNPRTFKAPRLAKEIETTILRVDQYKDKEKDEGWKVRKRLMAQMDKRREDWWKHQRCRHEDSDRFWDKGVFVGDEVAVNDDEDIHKIEAIVVVEYTDGDREDMDNDEMKNASEQVEVSGANDDTPVGSLCSDSGEEESYVPSLQVSLSAYFYSICTPY
jgi:hypothetical protein